MNPFSGSVSRRAYIRDASSNRANAAGEPGSGSGPDRTRAYDHAGNLVREWFPDDNLTCKYDYECLEAQGP
jgi:hypothetical protein